MSDSKLKDVEGDYRMSSPHEVLFTAALEQLPEGIVIVDAEDRIVFANSKAEEVRRIRFADIEGGDVRDCHPVESSERVERALAHIRKTRDAVFTRMVVDSVKERTYENTYAGLVGDNKEYLGLLVLTRDITDRLELESARASHMHALSQEVERLSRHLHELFVASMTALVNVLEAKDPYTAGHSDRVSEMAETMAMHAWGVAPATSELALAGKLHDIGKVGLRTEVLNKPGPLNEDEWHHVRTHPEAGERILSPIVKLSAVTRIVRHHHERFDGTGYPDGLAGTDIPEGSRILSIADAYDAMTSNRPYREALDPVLAAKEIRANAGKQFDPQWTELFLDLFETGTIG